MSIRFSVAALVVLAAVAALACGASEHAVARSASSPESASLTPAPATVETVQSPATGPEVGSSRGNRTPDFEIRLVGGKLVNSGSLIAESRPTFLFFLATW